MGLGNVFNSSLNGTPAQELGCSNPAGSADNCSRFSHYDRRDLPVLLQVLSEIGHICRVSVAVDDFVLFVQTERGDTFSHGRCRQILFRNAENSAAVCP